MLLGPETPQIEGQLTVMLNRQKVNSSPPNEVEYDVVVDGKLPEIVAAMNYASKAIHHNLRLGRSNAMGQKGATRLRECGANGVEDTRQKPLESQAALGF